MNNTAEGQPKQSESTNRGVVRWLAKETMGVLMLPLLLFLSAGTLAWPMAWALCALTAGWVAATAAVVIPRHPELLAERVGPKRGGKRWDTVILSCMGLVSLVGYVVAGLEVRSQGTTGISLPLQIGALVVVAFGYALLVWATGTNAFFALTVRIQTERGHTVATQGPYRFVRHPGYVGGVLLNLATPVMLGSWWALIPFWLVVSLTVLRTALEDRSLKAELAGYVDYASTVRYRLLPGVW